MKKKIVLGIYGFCLSLVTLAQSPTWSGGIAEIIYKNCTGCHHTGGSGPFSMMSYNQTFNNRTSIKSVVSQKIMPPWPPDINYSQHAFSRALPAQDIEAITRWIESGAQSGDLAKAPLPPVYNDAAGFIKDPELSISIPAYTLSSSQDEYRCFIDSTSLKKDMWMTALECIPGNAEIVHHVLIFKDNSERGFTMDSRDAGPGYVCFGSSGSSSAELIAAWVPGAQPFSLPKGFGVKLNAGTNIIIQVHYPGGFKGKTDQTKIKLRLTEAPQREAYLVPALNHETSMVNGPLVIPANSKKTFTEKFVTPLSFSLIGVAPHMHLIGSSIKTWAVGPDQKEIPLISIPEWDFHWQGIYQFPTIKKIPAGSTLFSEASYDNTSSNHHNPNFPPKEVRVGEATTDEMMLTYFLFALYQNGDEKIIIDSSASLVSGASDIRLEKRNVSLSPNPSGSQSQAVLSFKSSAQDKVTISIFNLQGKQLYRHTESYPDSGVQSSILTPGPLATGIYLIKTQGRNWTSSLKWVVI